MTETTMLDVVRVYGVYVDGTAHEPGAERIPRYSPATGEKVAEFTQSTRADVEQAIDSARREFDTGRWPAMSGKARSDVLLRLAQLMNRDREKLARIEAAEVGKPLRLARADITDSIALTEYAASLAVHTHGDVYTNLGPELTGLVTREPAGVVGMITPWNFPLLVLFHKLPFALAAGCTAVCKPSEITSGSTLEVAALLQEAGAPSGVFSVVTGTGDRAGAMLTGSPKIDVLTFTGSTRVGREVIKASEGNITRVALELGGKGASIVFPDADLAQAVDGVLFANTFNQGECCVAGARLLVHEDVADEFVRALGERVRRLRVGGPFDDGADIGAMIHPGHLEKVLSYVSDAAKEGGRIVAGGNRLNGGAYEGGLYMEPTIVDRVAATSRLFTEEIFGPVLGVTRFRTTDEAIRLANAVEYGLANSVWTKDLHRALHVARAIRSGTVWVNTAIDGAPQLPQGGFKRSGFGREKGEAGFEEFTVLKTIQLRMQPRDFFDDDHRNND